MDTKKAAPRISGVHSPSGGASGVPSPSLGGSRNMCIPTHGSSSNRNKGGINTSQASQPLESVGAQETKLLCLLEAPQTLIIPWLSP